jgi:hypothetical protein
MKRIAVLSYFLFLISYFSFSQNVGIGTITPDPSSVLEIQSTNKGMLVPRIALVAANSASPVTTPADALLIYNIATSGAGSNAVSPGFYYWSIAGSRWIAISVTTSNNGNTGFGVWGDCATNGNISEYNPAVADDGAAGDAMGSSVSISGSYAIIGAPLDDVGGNNNQGSAYIFYYNGSGWVQQQKLTALDGAANDAFGLTVFISGNYAIIGSAQDDIGANTDQGSAYIYFYNGSTWVQQQKLIASDGVGSDFFGARVSISGNYAAIATYLDDVGINTDQGSVYIFFYNGSSWIQPQKLLAADGTAGDNFGSSVSISGNYVVIGANQDAPAGSAYVFNYNGSTWVQQQKLNGSDITAGEGFASDVSVSGNYIVIGASSDDIGAVANQGSAYIFYYNGTSWIELQKLTAPDPGTDDAFGDRVSISGNYVIISSLYDDIGSSANQGSAYIFQNINNVWRLLQKVVAPGGYAQDNFGASSGINSGRFIICAPAIAASRGMAFFGKIN